MSEYYLVIFRTVKVFLSQMLNDWLYDIVGGMLKQYLIWLPDFPKVLPGFCLTSKAGEHIEITIIQVQPRTLSVPGLHQTMFCSSLRPDIMETDVE